jgi:hypothetical protein
MVKGFMNSRKLKSLGNILGPAVSQRDLVEAVYLATRLLSHRAVVAARGISPKAFIDWVPASSKKGRRLAIEVVEEIVKRESAPLDKIPQKTVDSYILALSELMWRRLKQEHQYNEERGTALLEELRRTGEFSRA